MSDISDFVQEIVPAYRCVHTPDKFPVHVYTDHDGDNHDRSLQAKKAKCQMVTVAWSIQIQAAALARSLARSPQSNGKPCYTLIVVDRKIQMF